LAHSGPGRGPTAPWGRACFGEDLVEVLGDHVRLEDHPVAMRERRDDPVRVELQVPIALLLEPGEVEPAGLPGEALFEERDAHAPGAGRADRVVEQELRRDGHRAPPPSTASGS